MDRAKQIARARFARPQVLTNEQGPEGVFVIIGPSATDDHELARLNQGRLTILRHEYGGSPGPTGTPLSLLEQVDVILARLEGCHVTGVISTDNYPGSILACIVAERLGLAGPRPAANLLCQHKYLARLTQKALVPDAVPQFAAVDIALGPNLPLDLVPPFTLQPIAPFSSSETQWIDRWEALEDARTQWRNRAHLFSPFEELLERFTPYRPSTRLLLAEEPQEGAKVTLEGYAQGAEIHIFGIVDAVPQNGIAGPQRYEYPSALSHALQSKMVEVARRLICGTGYSDGLFTIELTHNAQSDQLGIVRVNPCIASQFAYLYEMVDGMSSYQILLDLAAGQTPQLRWREGPDVFASVCSTPITDDNIVAAFPSRHIA